MNTPSTLPLLKGCRFQREIIAYGIWVYYRFAFSTTDIEDLFVERGVTVGRETVRKWMKRFGCHFANCIKRDRPSAADIWHLDELVIPVNGRKYWLWRAVDANGDVLVQPQRNAIAAPRFLKRLIAWFVEPWVIVTDKLCSYFKLSRELVPNADHRSHKGLSNLIEGSHTPTRRREKVIGRFKSPRQAQRSIAGHDQADTVFQPRRYRAFAISYRHARDDAIDRWNTYAVEMTT